MTSRYVTATEFKAECLALIDDVEAGATSITVTRRGTPVAVVSPVKAKPIRSLRDSWKGKIEIKGDLVRMDWAERWELD